MMVIKERECRPVVGCGHPHDRDALDGNPVPHHAADMNAGGAVFVSLKGNRI